MLLSFTVFSSQETLLWAMTIAMNKGGLLQYCFRFYRCPVIVILQLLCLQSIVAPEAADGMSAIQIQRFSVSVPITASSPSFFSACLPSPRSGLELPPGDCRTLVDVRFIPYKYSVFGLHLNNPNHGGTCSEEGRSVDPLAPLLEDCCDCYFRGGIPGGMSSLSVIQPFAKAQVWTRSDIWLGLVRYHASVWVSRLRVTMNYLELFLQGELIDCVWSYP